MTPRIIPTDIHNRFINKPSWFWARLLFILAVLSLSAYFAILVAKSQRLNMLITDPLFVGIGAIGTFIIFTRWPPLGIALLILVSLVNTSFPEEGIFRYLNPTLLLLAFLVGHWILDITVRQRNIKLNLSRSRVLLMILVMITLISFGIGQLNWFIYRNQAPLDAQIAGLALIIFSVGAFFLMAYQVKELIWLKRITWLFIIIGGFYIVGRTIPGLGSYVNLVFIRSATGGASLFWIWVVSLALSQGLFNTDLGVKWRILLFGLVAATMYVSVVQSYGWKSGWIPSIFVIGLLILLRYPKIGLLLVFIGVILSGDVISQILVSDEYSYATRIEAWKIVVGDIVKVSPIFGLGPANYRYYTSMFSIFGYNIPFNSHNNYIDILAQIGILGLVFLLWFFFEIGRLGWRLRTQISDGFSKAYVYGVLGGLIGMVVAGMLGDWVIPFVYNIGLAGFRASVLGWLFMGGLLALKGIASRESEPL